MSLFCAALSLTGFIFSVGASIGLVGIISALYAKVSIRKYPDELTGSKLASIGLGTCLMFFLSITATNVFFYLTEVPADHARVTFGQIETPKHKKYEPTERALELDGKKVFIKGYTFPGKQRKNLSQFLLVGDFGQCCFGGDPEPSHLVRVSIRGNKKVDYSLRLRKTHRHV